jgi:hypothetical protein
VTNSVAKTSNQTEDDEVDLDRASTILGMPRSLVVHRMDVGDLPCRLVGKHRRAKLKDVLALKRLVDNQQMALNALAAETEKLITACSRR